jgi:hypothetical protein
VKRREFIAALAGAATIPFPARAQQQARIRRIAMFLGIKEHDPEAQVRLGAMLDELQRLGWTSANLDIVYRWSGDDAELVRAYAAELVAHDRRTASRSRSALISPSRAFSVSSAALNAETVSPQRPRACRLRL